jgi:hypothetical protein
MCGRLSVLDEMIAGLRRAQDIGMATDGQKDQLKELIAERRKTVRILRRLTRECERQKRRRADQKEAIERLANTRDGGFLKKFCRSKASRPRVEDDQPQLIQTLIEIASIGTAADIRRQTDITDMSHTRCSRSPAQEAWPQHREDPHISAPSPQKKRHKTMEKTCGNGALKVGKSHE